MSARIQSKEYKERCLTRYAITGTLHECWDAISQLSNYDGVREAHFYGPFHCEGGVYGAMGEVFR